MTRTLLGPTAAIMCVAFSTEIAFGGIDTYEFSWDHGETTWFRFANNEWVGQHSPADYWTADVEDDETIVGFLDSFSQTHSTAASVGGATVTMKLVIKDVAGTFDLLSDAADWTIEAVVRFRAQGQITSDCDTSSFLVTFDGDYNGGNYSDVFTIPALSGSSSQDCDGWYSALNSHFSLGSSGGYLYFNKFTVAML